MSETKLTAKQRDVLSEALTPDGTQGYYHDEKGCAKRLCRRGLMEYRGTRGIKGRGWYAITDAGRAALAWKERDEE